MYQDSYLRKNLQWEWLEEYLITVCVVELYTVELEEHEVILFNKLSKTRKISKESLFDFSVRYCPNA